MNRLIYIGENTHFRFKMSFLFFFLFLCSNGNSQNADPEFTRIRTTEGVVQCILRDSRGFVWFGTQGGLDRYDGYTIKKFNKQNTNGALSHNIILSIWEDKGGILWVGTGEGLNRFDQQKQIIQSFHNIGQGVNYSDNSITAIHAINDSLLLLGTYSYPHLFNKNTGIFQKVEFDNKYAPFQTNCILRSDGGRAFIATIYGLFVYDPDEVSAKVKYGIHDFKKLYGKNITSIIFSNQNELLAAYSDGYYKINLKTNEISFQKLADHLKENNFGVRSLLKDSEGNFWFGTNSGLIKYDVRFKKYSHFRHNTAKINSISSDRINKLFEDDNGLLWVSTFGGQVNKINLKKKNFMHLRYSTEPTGFKLNFIMYIFGDENGNIWISSLDKGFAIYNPRTSRLYYYALLKEQMKKKNMMIQYFAFPFEKNRFSVFDVDSLITYKISNDMKVNKLSSSPAFINFLYMMKDKQNTIWGADYSGLRKLTNNNGKLYYYDKNYTPLNSPCNFILDADSLIWLGTSKDGLFRFSKNNSSLKQFRQSDYIKTISMLNTIYYIHDDRKGNLWIGTYSDGMLKFEIEKEKFTSYSTKNGLPDNTVYGILDDAEGNLWISTNNGLSKFIVAENKFVNYDKSDGLINEEYNRRACYKDKDGILYFGGINGVDYFNPNKIVSSEMKSNVMLTDFKLFNESYPTEIEYSYLKEINLSHDQNSFSFQFASLDITDPVSNQYLYRMDNIDKDWIAPGTDRTAIYTRLSPGEYILRVKATNSDGYWNEAGLSIKININPPFWGTWWFKSLIAFLIVGSALFTFKRKTDKLEKEKNVQEQYSQNLILSVENERKRIARELHDGLGQNLLIIKNKAYSTTSENQNENMHEEVKSIENLAMSSLTEIREIAYNLHPHQIDRLGLTKAIESSLTPLIVSSQIKFTYHIDNIDQLIPKEYEINIFRIVQESLNNIIKHSQARNASVVIINKDGLITINIEDDGIGFEVEEALLKNSLGIASFNERVKILKGEISINSKVMQGTSIEVKVNSKQFS